MSRRTLVRTILAGAATAAVAVAAGSPAAAAPDRVLRWEEFIPHLYDNLHTEGHPDYVLFAGSTPGTFCGLEPPTGIDFRVKVDGPAPEPGSSDRFWFTDPDAPLSLYEDPGGGAFAVVADYCDGGDVPQPIATGTGVHWMRGGTVYDGDTALRTESNGARGVLRTPDGDVLHVSACSDNELELLDPFTPDERAGASTTFVVTVTVRGGR